MTAEPAPVTRVVTVARSKFGYAQGYFTALVGCRIAFMDGDHGVYGTLLEADEGDEEITLTLSDVRRED